jgi:hypothetical protein
VLFCLPYGLRAFKSQSNQSVIKKKKKGRMLFLFLGVGFLPFFFFQQIYNTMTAFSTRQYPDTLVLFDVDGTLTPARNVSIPFF